ncbi:hypothetical protein ACFX15_020654 [Malus domestica]
MRKAKSGFELTLLMLVEQLVKHKLTNSPKMVSNVNDYDVRLVLANWYPLSSRRNGILTSFPGYTMLKSKDHLHHV